jgi:hypothetical protein
MFCFVTPPVAKAAITAVAWVLLSVNAAWAVASVVEMLMSIVSVSGVPVASPVPCTVNLAELGEHVGTLAVEAPAD